LIQVPNWKNDIFKKLTECTYLIRISISSTQNWLHMNLKNLHKSCRVVVFQLKELKFSSAYYFKKNSKILFNFKFQILRSDFTGLKKKLNVYSLQIVWVNFSRFFWWGNELFRIKKVDMLLQFWVQISKFWCETKVAIPISVSILKHRL